MKTIRLAFTAMIVAVVTAAQPQTSSFVLVSPAEYQAEVAGAAAAETEFELFVKGNDVGAPAIQVQKPQIDKGVKPPVDIEVRFVPERDVSVNLDSLRILYGMLRIDVTSRVLEHASVTAQGVSAPGADLPRGTHTLTIEIADTLGRTARQRFKFEVI